LPQTPQGKLTALPRTLAGFREEKKREGEREGRQGEEGKGRCKRGERKGEEKGGKARERERGEGIPTFWTKVTPMLLTSLQRVVEHAVFNA